MAGCQAKGGYLVSGFFCQKSIREDLGGFPVWVLHWYRGRPLQGPVYAQVFPVRKPRHRRDSNSTVFLHPSGLWVRGGKNWVERIDQ
jgi:hypothetical protein